MLAAPVCYYAIQLVKNRPKIDDSLDVFALHGVGGILGTLLYAVFALRDERSVGERLIAQLTGIGVVALFSAVVTVLIAWVVAKIIRVRVDEDEERHGLDSATHGEHTFKLD